jgi:serine/threonine protein kinase
VGTIFYMAPEVLLLASYRGSALEAAVSKRVGEKMDVWSLGVCLFELAAGAPVFGTASSVATQGASAACTMVSTASHDVCHSLKGSPAQQLPAFPHVLSYVERHSTALNALTLLR